VVILDSDASDHSDNDSEDDEELVAVHRERTRRVMEDDSDEE